MENETGKNNALKFIKEILNDSLTKKFIENSHLTKIQVETLLIHFLVDVYSDERTSYDLKGRLRTLIDKKKLNYSLNKKSSGVSRGAFRRVLNQAARNITKSIYTLILLGYLGLLETPSLQPFVELSNLIKEYYDTVKETTQGSRELHEQKLKILYNQIESLVDKYTEALLVKKEYRFQ